MSNSSYFRQYKDCTELLRANLAASHTQEQKSRLKSLIDNLSDTRLIIADPDFAAGIRFLTTLQIWRQYPKHSAHCMHYIGKLAQPLSPTDLSLVLDHHPELQAETAELLRNYYLLLPGHQRISFAGGVELTLIIGAENCTASVFPPGSYCSENSNPTRLSSVQAAKPWFARQVCQPDSSVVVIGAGISGAATAHKLATRGFQVTVYEKNSQPAQEASGNYQGMLYGSWSSFASASMELSCSAYRYSHALIKQQLRAGIDYLDCGLVQLAHTAQQFIRNQQLLAANFPPDFIAKFSQQQIKQAAGQAIHPADYGLFFPHGLCLNPPALVTKLLDHPNIRVINNCEISRLEFSSNQWFLYAKSFVRPTSTPLLILCNAHAANLFAQLEQLSLRKIRGQISIVSQTNQLKTVLCGASYVTPSQGGKYTLGASFKFNDEVTDIRNAEHWENLENLRKTIPSLIEDIKVADLAGHASLRTSSHDYLPLCGPIAEHQQFLKDYAKLAVDKNYRITTPCKYHPGLYLNIAHGAKGLLTAPYCAEIIAAYLENSPLPCSEQLRLALHPNRLYVKDLVRDNSRR